MTLKRFKTFEIANVSKFTGKVDPYFCFAVMERFFKFSKISSEPLITTYKTR